MRWLLGLVVLLALALVTPDNLSFNGDDIFWVAMPDLRTNIDEMAVGRYSL
jgi:hypothetical protein